MNGKRTPALAVAALALGAGVMLVAGAGPARADGATNCGGAAMLGGTELSCSHVDPKAPTQFCTYSWALMTTAGTPSIVEGSFMLAPGIQNLVVYQSGGFASALSNPIILCQGRGTP